MACSNLIKTKSFIALRRKKEFKPSATNNKIAA